MFSVLVLVKLIELTLFFYPFPYFFITCPWRVSHSFYPVLAPRVPVWIYWPLAATNIQHPFPFYNHLLGKFLPKIESWLSLLKCKSLKTRKFPITCKSRNPQLHLKNISLQLSLCNLLQYLDNLPLIMNWSQKCINPEFLDSCWKKLEIQTKIKFPCKTI